MKTGLLALGGVARGGPQGQPGTPQAEKKQLAVAEKTIKDLQRRSQQVAPLQQRRNPPQQPLHVDSICDWDSGEVRARPAPPQPCPLRSHPLPQAPSPTVPQALPGLWPVPALTPS